MNDVEVGVEALCQTFGQVFLERDVQVRVTFYRFLQFLKTIAQICPFFCSLKGLVDALKLLAEDLHLRLVFFLCKSNGVRALEDLTYPIVRMIS